MATWLIKTARLTTAGVAWRLKNDNASSDGSRGQSGRPTGTPWPGSLQAGAGGSRCTWRLPVAHLPARLVPLVGCCPAVLLLAAGLQGALWPAWATRPTLRAGASHALSWSWRLALVGVPGRGGAPLLCQFRLVHARSRCSGTWSSAAGPSVMAALDGDQSVLRAPSAYYLPAALVGKVAGLGFADPALLVWTGDRRRLVPGAGRGAGNSFRAAIIIVACWCCSAAWTCSEPCCAVALELAAMHLQADRPPRVVGRAVSSTPRTRHSFSGCRTMRCPAGSRQRCSSRNQDNPAFLRMLPVVVALIPLLVAAHGDRFRALAGWRLAAWRCDRLAAGRSSTRWRSSPAW